MNGRRIILAGVEIKWGREVIVTFDVWDGFDAFSNALANIY
jgi:hypothetical protein